MQSAQSNQQTTHLQKGANKVHKCLYAKEELIFTISSDKFEIFPDNPRTFEVRITRWFS